MKLYYTQISQTTYVMIFDTLLLHKCDSKKIVNHDITLY